MSMDAILIVRNSEETIKEITIIDDGAEHVVDMRPKNGKWGKHLIIELPSGDSGSRVLKKSL